MSRIGKKPIALPTGVTVKMAEHEIHVNGPKGKLSKHLPSTVRIQIEKDRLVVAPIEAEDRGASAMQGLARSLIQNMVTGVSQGFVRILEINGVGYRAEVKKQSLQLVLGYSHPIEMMLPEGISAKVEKNRIELTGSDRESLGQFAAVVRAQRPPEPYKGKGIKYVEETIRRKVGKTGAS